MLTNIFTKFDKDLIKHFDLESGNPNFGQVKGHNSGVPGDLTGYRTLSIHFAHQHIHQV